VCEREEHDAGHVRSPHATCQGALTAHCLNMQTNTTCMLKGYTTFLCIQYADLHSRTRRNLYTHTLSCGNPGKKMTSTVSWHSLHSPILCLHANTSLLAQKECNNQTEHWPATHRKSCFLSHTIQASMLLQHCKDTDCTEGMRPLRSGCTQTQRTAAAHYWLHDTNCTAYLSTNVSMQHTDLHAQPRTCKPAPTTLPLPKDSI
jgi:hypothetical protein